MGKDHTLHATCKGKVFFSKDYDSKKTYVNIIPEKPFRLPRPGLPVPDVVHLYKAGKLDMSNTF